SPLSRLNALMFCFASRRRHTRSKRDWSSDVCSSDLLKTFEDQFAFNSYYRYNFAPRWKYDARYLDSVREKIEKFSKGTQLSLNEIGRASCREKVLYTVVDAS